MVRIAGIFLAALASAASADTVTYLAYESFGKTWHDAEKAFDGQDDYLCWAAAASNVLSYNEWSASGVPAAQSEDEIFQEFKDHWANVGGWPSEAWIWWMYGDMVGYSAIDVPGGGGHWPDGNYSIWNAAFAQYYRQAVFEPDGSYYFTAHKLMDFANIHLRAGYGATLYIHRPGWVSSHCITLWGFDYDTDLQTYTGIHYTDSDDLLEQLAWSSIHLGTADGHPTNWVMSGGPLDQFEILGIDALNDARAVPEPMTLLLLGAAALAGAARRRG